MTDPYTTEARLCDDRGLISDEPVDMVSAAPGLTYRRLLNNLRSHTGLPPYDGAPVVCTGSAHLAREHIRCTSPAHVTTSNTVLARACAPSGVTVVTAAVACACDPNPATTDGPVPWCDLHGQPSVAYEHGYAAGHRDARNPTTAPTRAEVLHTADLAALAALNEHLPASKRYGEHGSVTKVCACGLESDGAALTARTQHLAEVAGPAVAEQLQALGWLPWREES